MKRAIIGAAIAALALAGCAKGNTAGYSQPGQDAPVSNRGHEDFTPAEVVGMPDGFSNFATKCNNGNRVYVLYHGYGGRYGAIAVVPNDPTCP